MKNTTNQHHKGKKAALLALAFPLVLAGAPVQAAQRTYVASETALPSPQIVGIKRLNPTAVEVLFANNQRMTLDFYGDNIFRIFQDNAGGIIRNPEAKPEAQILVDNPRMSLSKLDIDDNGSTISITTGHISIQIDKATSLLKITNLKTGKVVVEELDRKSVV